MPLRVQARVFCVQAYLRYYPGACIYLLGACVPGYLYLLRAISLSTL